jgi:hypothetical protein
MKIRILLGTVAILGLVLGSTHAFNMAGSIQADIPFAFVIGDKVLPPATYIIDVASVTGPGVLTIRKTETGERVMFDTEQMPEKADPKMVELVFDTVGDKTYLTEVWGVVDSGRASRQHVAAVRIGDQKEKKSGK